VGETIYRIPAPKPPAPPDPYLLAWASLRRWRVTMWVSLLAFVPACALGGFLGSLVDGPGELGAQPAILLALFIFGPLVVTAGVSTFMVTWFQCPHCGKQFAENSPGWEPSHEQLTRNCAHCGIRVGTPRSAIVADATGDVAPGAQHE
jgi:hypothetical protein